MSREPRVHWRAPGTTWAWCSASIHGHRTTAHANRVTCSLCKIKGRPPARLRLRAWWQARQIR